MHKPLKETKSENLDFFELTVSGFYLTISGYGPRW